MKSITAYIYEKLIINKNNRAKNKYNTLDQIIDILKKHEIDRIDRYNEDNIPDNIYYDENNLIDNIQFEDDYTNVTLFYILNTGDEEEEGDITIDIDEWYSYISEKDTKRILDKLNNIYK